MPNFNRSDRRVPPTEQSIHHILLVEDSAVQGLRMKQLLELEGLTVDWVEDGPEGLEQAQQHHYDLIVLDVAFLINLIQSVDRMTLVAIESICQLFS